MGLKRHKGKLSLVQPLQDASVPAVLDGPSAKDSKAKPEGEEEEESDIDLSDEGGAQEGEGKSDVEEDWGLWD